MATLSKAEVEAIVDAIVDAILKRSPLHPQTPAQAVFTPDLIVDNSHPAENVEDVDDCHSAGDAGDVHTFVDGIVLTPNLIVDECYPADVDECHPYPAGDVVTVSNIARASNIMSLPPSSVLMSTISATTSGVANVANDGKRRQWQPEMRWLYVATFKRRKRHCRRNGSISLSISPSSSSTSSLSSSNVASAVSNLASHCRTVAVSIVASHRLIDSSHYCYRRRAIAVIVAVDIIVAARVEDLRTGHFVRLGECHGTCDP